MNPIPLAFYTHFKAVLNFLAISALNCSYFLIFLNSGLVARNDTYKMALRNMCLLLFHPANISSANVTSWLITHPAIDDQAKLWQVCVSFSSLSPPPPPPPEIFLAQNVYPLTNYQTLLHNCFSIMNTSFALIKRRQHWWRHHTKWGKIEFARFFDKMIKSLAQLFILLWLFRSFGIWMTFSSYSGTPV